MVQNNIDFTKFSRRSFLAGAGGLALASALPSKFALAQECSINCRPNLSSAAGAAALADYRIAIQAMLDLPPTDSRNWYRYTLIHTLDCPHGNWWFLPWHRAYIGWLEQICRQMIDVHNGDEPGTSQFMLPYWDWTTQPRIPEEFFEGILNPANYPDNPYGDGNDPYGNFDDFKTAFYGPMSDFYDSLPPGSPQRIQLEQREATFVNGDGETETVTLDTVDNLFDTLEYTPFFFARPDVRVLNEENPYLPEQLSPRSASPPSYVSRFTIEAALAPMTFEGFGSPMSDDHNEMSGFELLESQPHNQVHNEIGGFMQDNMSPVDPLFFMHHGNIERLWDVWTRKQEQIPGGELVPSDPKWADEPLLFYVNADGNPVAQDTAGDYATTDIFGNYTYEPGFGEQVVPSEKLLTKTRTRVFLGNVIANKLDFSNLATSNIALPQRTLRSVVGDNALGLVIAEITIIPPKVTRNLIFNVLVNAPEGKRNIGVKSPHFAGSFQFFGHHYHNDKPVTFAIALTQALKSLRAANKLNRNQPLQVSVVPDTKGVTLNSLESVLKSVKLKFY